MNHIISFWLQRLQTTNLFCVDLNLKVFRELSKTLVIFQGILESKILSRNYVKSNKTFVGRFDLRVCQKIL